MRATRMEDETRTDRRSMDQIVEDFNSTYPPDRGEEIVGSIMQDVVDLEHNSCEDDPELCHVTRDELAIILRRHILGEE